MPIHLDACITGIFVPGNIGASSGLPPVVRDVPSLGGAAPAVEETVTATDTLDFFMGGLLYEAASASDSYAATGGAYAVLIAEAAVAVDAVYLPQVFSEVVAEVAPATDAPSVREPGVVAAAVTETTAAADAPDGTVVSGVWSPANLGSALRAWYKFNELTGSNGSAQPSVTDASGNGFNLSQVTSGNQPTLTVADLNGKNTLAWNGSTTYYQLANAIFSGSAAGSAYVVIKIPYDFIGCALMDWGTATGTSNWPYSDGNFYPDFGSTAIKTFARTVTSTVYRIYSVYSAASDWAFYVDGGTGGSAGGTSPLYSTSTNTVAWRPGAVDLGRDHLANIMNGWLAEVVFTNAKQSTTDRQKMEGYLAHKWGLTGNLSSSHPYKTTPP